MVNGSHNKQQHELITGITAHVVDFRNPTCTAIPGHFFLEQALYAELEACSESLPFILNIGKLYHGKNIWGGCSVFFDVMASYVQPQEETREAQEKANKTKYKTKQNTNLLDSQTLRTEVIACHMRKHQSGYEAENRSEGNI